MKQILQCYIVMISLFLLPVANVQAQCPVSIDCPHTYQSFGNGGENNCSIFYAAGIYGNLRVPVKVFTLGTNVNTTNAEIDAALAGVSTYFQGKNFHVEFFRTATIIEASTNYNNFCWPVSGNTSCACADNGDDLAAIDAISQANSNVLCLFIADTLIKRSDIAPNICSDNLSEYEYALAGFPGASSYLGNNIVIKQRMIQEQRFGVLAHELGHLFGLFHTFAQSEPNPPFPTVCQTPATREGDGIMTTPFDDNGLNTTATGNLMDTEDLISDPTNWVNASVDTCQVAKMAKTLWSCRGILCFLPSQPDVLNTNNLSVNTLIYDRGDPMDTLHAVLNAVNRTNTGNFAKFKLKNASGAVLYNAFTQTLNLNAVFALATVPDYGVFTLEVVDSSFHNSLCNSNPTIVNITIHPCNGDNICDPEESFSNCADCQFSNGTPRPLITAAEYYVDTDPGFGLATAIPFTPDSIIDLNVNIPLSGVSTGVHVLYVRTKNALDKWSFPQKKIFYLYNATGGTKQLVQMEYYIDNDPGYGMATQIPIGSSAMVDVNQLVSTSGLNGQHKIFVRTKDNWGQWSFVAGDTLIWSLDTLKIVSPNGGQTYTTGGNITNISFTRSAGIGPVTIQLVRPNGDAVHTIASGVTTSPYASWAVPLTLNAGQYKIKIFEDSEPTVSDYSDNTFQINNAANICSVFTDLSAPGELLNSASCLCGLSYITPQSYNSYNNTYGVNPSSTILRADIAKLIYFAIYQGNDSSPAETFPVPFADLQQSTDPYFKYAKALSYLQYQDDVTPFDRDFINFRPFEPLQIRYALKVLFEAYNIAPNNSTAGVILGLNPGDDGYGYVHEAVNRGLLPTSMVDATSDMIRGDMFIILYRLLNSCSGTCNADCHDPNPTASDYFNPGNFTPFNLNRNIGVSEGYFQSYNKTSFNIPGIKLPMTFTHLYNSYLTQMPRKFLKSEPLGEGWSHSYNANVFKEKGWTNGTTVFPDKYIVVWPDGTMNTYNGNTLSCESYGVYDKLYISGSSQLIVQKQNQIRFFFQKYVIASDTIYMLDKIQDRFYNTVNIVNEVVGNVVRVDKVIDTGGRIMDFIYDSSDPRHLKEVYDQSGDRIIQFNVNANNNLTYFINALGDTTVYSYGTNPSLHLLHTIQKPEGNVISNTYDTQKRLASISQPNIPSMTIDVQTNYGTGNDYRSIITDPTNTVMEQKFDAKGFLKEKKIGTTQMNLMRTMTTDPSRVTQQNYAGFVTNYAYDALGRPTTITLPTGLTHMFTYTSLNDVATYKNPRNHITTYAYDGYGGIDKVTDALGFVTDFTSNSKGQITKVVNPTGITTNYTFNNKGDLIKSTQPLGIVTNIEFDSIGRMIKLINPKNQVTEFEFNALDLLETQTRKSTLPSNDIATMFHFNKNELLDTITNALGGKTIYKYDSRDLLSEMTFGDDTKHYTYRDDGLLNTFQSPKGVVFQLQYDALGRKTSDGYVSNITYDQYDNVKSITKDSKTILMNYDVLNRMDTVNYDGFSVIYTYDGNNNVTKIKYPGGLEVNYVYDANDRLSSIQWSGKTITYSWLNDGRINQVNFPNGTYRKYDYDAAGRNIGIAEMKSMTDTIASYQFVLDLLGNHLQEIMNEPLCSPNLVSGSATSTYNTENEILTVGNSNFTHDANGNRILKDGVSFTFDPMDKLVGFAGKEYEIDGLGMRRSVTIGSATKKYIWDIRGMGNILAETDAFGTIAFYYIHGFGLEARVNATTGAVHYYHADYRGSIIALTDSAKVVTHRYNYLPFGEIANQQEADPNPFKYVGKYGIMDEGDSIYYMRARYMDAVSGRFLSEDPVWHDNLYPYAGNNPIGMVDLNGKEGVTVKPENGFTSTTKSFNDDHNGAVKAWANTDNYKQAIKEVVSKELEPMVESYLDLTFGSTSKKTKMETNDYISIEEYISSLESKKEVNNRMKSFYRKKGEESMVMDIIGYTEELSTSLNYWKSYLDALNAK